MKILMFSFCCLIILFCVIPSGSIAQETDTTLARAFRTIDENKVDAIRLFRNIVESNPENVLARRQLGSLLIGQEQHKEALKQFIIADSLFPSDTTKLQIAYLLNIVGQNQEALNLFHALSETSISSIQRKAKLSAAVLQPVVCVETSEWWNKLYLSPYYDSRFSNTIFLFNGMAGRYLGNSRSLSLFANIALTKDTRSSGGVAPQIFSDNYILLGGGIKYQPLSSFFTLVQIGAAAGLTERPGMSNTEVDFRALAIYGDGLYPPISLNDDVTLPFAPFAETYVSLGYYSRYKNSIGYGLVRGGLRTAAFGYSSLDLYLRFDSSIDTENIFFNNVAEVSLGLRLVPDFRWGASLLVEYHWGTYWRGQSPPAIEKYYQSFRLFLVLDTSFCL